MSQCHLLFSEHSAVNLLHNDLEVKVKTPKSKGRYKLQPLMEKRPLTSAMHSYNFLHRKKVSLETLAATPVVPLVAIN